MEVVVAVERFWMALATLGSLAARSGDPRSDDAGRRSAGLLGRRSTVRDRRRSDAIVVVIVALVLVVVVVIIM